MAKITGKAARFNIGLVSLPFRKITPQVNRICQPFTDSTCYDPVNKLMWPVQKPISAPVTMLVEGWYDTIVIPNGVMLWLLTGLTGVPCSIFLRSGLELGAGNFDITNFEMGIPFDDMCSYSFTAISNGPFAGVYFF